MKPTPQTPALSSRHDTLAGSHRPAMPKIEYNFRASSLDEFNHRGEKSAPSFRDISGNYFQEEAPRAFATEAAIFGLIVVTVAVPLFSSANAAFHLFRSFGL